eukprot:g1026.t1
MKDKTRNTDMFINTSMKGKDNDEWIEHIVHHVSSPLHNLDNLQANRSRRKLFRKKYESLARSKERTRPRTSSGNSQSIWSTNERGNSKSKRRPNTRSSKRSQMGISPRTARLERRKMPETVGSSGKRSYRPKTSHAGYTTPAPSSQGHSPFRIRATTAGPRTSPRSKLQFTKTEELEDFASLERETLLSPRGFKSFLRSRGDTAQMSKEKKKAMFLLTNYLAFDKFNQSEQKDVLEKLLHTWMTDDEGSLAKGPLWSRIHRYCESTYLMDNLFSTCRFPNALSTALCCDILKIIAQQETPYKRLLNIVKTGILSSCYSDFESGYSGSLFDLKTWSSQSEYLKRHADSLKEKAQNWDDFSLFMQSPVDTMVRTYQMLEKEKKKEFLRRVLLDERTDRKEVLGILADRTFNLLSEAEETESFVRAMDVSNRDILLYVSLMDDPEHFASFLNTHPEIIELLGTVLSSLEPQLIGKMLFRIDEDIRLKAISRLATIEFLTELLYNVDANTRESVLREYRLD